MNHIDKIDAGNAVRVFGYSTRKADCDLHDLTYLNYAGPTTTSAVLCGLPLMSEDRLYHRIANTWVDPVKDELLND